MGAFPPRKIAVLAIMCMKKQGLIGNSREGIKLYVAEEKGVIEKWRARRQKKGDPYLKDRAIMLLKTHIEKMSDNGLAIISMKIKGLFRSSHYVYEKKWTYLKPQIENEMGANVENRSVLSPRPLLTMSD